MARLKTLGSRIKESAGSRVKVVTPGSWRSGMTSSQRGYGYRWQKAREQYLRDNPLCVYCERNGRTTAARVVDHIVAHRGDMVLFWDQSNWQSLCKPCHDSVKQAEEAVGLGGLDVLESSKSINTHQGMSAASRYGVGGAKAWGSHQARPPPTPRRHFSPPSRFLLMVLTDKQRQFVDAKAKGASNKTAAEAAGCKASTAAASGSRWMKDPKIAAAILARKAELSVNPERKSRARKAKVDETAGDPAEVNEADGEFLSCLPSTQDPLEWLLALMNEPRAKVFDRRNAAQTAVPYIHGKKADAGKKEQKAEAAKAAGKGKYSQSKPPLTVVKG